MSANSAAPSISNYSSPDRFWRNNQDFLCSPESNRAEESLAFYVQQGYGTANNVDIPTESQKNLTAPLIALTTTVFSVASMFFAFKNESDHTLMMGGFISSGCFASMSAAACLYSACKN
jgi:hypothetical protein